MKRFILLATAMLFAGASTAQAQDMRVYAGLGGGIFGIEYEQPGLALNQNVGGALLKLGVDFNEYFGTEVRVGGTASGSSTVGATSVDMSVDLFTSAFLKLQYEAAQDFKLYGLVGATSAKLSRKQVTTPGGVVLVNDSASKVGVSFGAGAEFLVTENASVGLEWVQYWSDVEIGPTLTTTVWGAGVSINYYF